MNVSIQGEITDASALRTVAEIEAVPAAPLEIFLDSIGGSVTAATEIADAVRAHTGEVTGVCLKAHSAAVLPLMACAYIIMARDGEVLVHAATLHVAGGIRRNELDLVDASLRATENKVAAALSRRSKTCPSTFWSYLMSRNGGDGTMLSAESAVNYGLVDEISVWPMRHIRDKGRLP